jgi:hypothetical protein
MSCYNHPNPTPDVAARDMTDWSSGPSAVYLRFMLGWGLVDGASSSCFTSSAEVWVAYGRTGGAAGHVTWVQPGKRRTDPGSGFWVPSE